MKVLLNGKWNDGFLDYYRDAKEYRIQVLAWKNLKKLEDLYFIRSKNLRMVWNYLREVGLIAVLRKIISRKQERYRNEKYISYGLGRILESADETKFPLGQIVAFLAPCHPQCLERIVLPAELMIKVDGNNILPLHNQTILYLPSSIDNTQNNRWWAPLCGWNSQSGINISNDRSIQMMQKILEFIRDTNWQDSQHLPIDEQSPALEYRRQSLTNYSLNKKRAVLFGYGNYAKTIIIPNTRPYLWIDCIHEIDPTQIPINADFATRWDTSPCPRSEENYDVFLIAGFHHTHAPLAIYALQNNACAIIEKPAVVNEMQLAELLNVMQKSSGKLFVCFQKRYLPFNEMLIEDLGLGAGETASYHCIVYEVQLPELHWYRWPNSKGRLVSNGCHWIDHFLYLNNFCKVRSYDLFSTNDSIINCSIILENDAFFTMVLTDKGSERIGVQDYIELRANGVTARIINDSYYIAENRTRIIRRKKINKMQSYKAMYHQIGRKITDGAEGDSLESVKVSAGIILALENKFLELLGIENNSK